MPPVTVLNVAEKPSVARALAGVFSQIPGTVDRPMVRTAAQVFTQDNVQFTSIHAQGQGQHVNGPMQPHTMITTSVRGHLASQDFGPAYGWSAVPPISLFDAPIEQSYRGDMQGLEQMLTQQSRRAQALILWLDCDREGEAIGEEVRQVCCKSNPRLQVYRARFSTVMPQEIKRALSSLGRLNMHLVQAVQARSELDLRVGAAFTRFQTLRLQKKFDGFANGEVVSYGPCQFPTLGFVVERWARIETFVPEDFWFLDLTLTVPTQQQNARSIHFTWKRGKLYDRLATLVLLDSCLDAREAVVTELSGRPKNRWRPVPLATVELQKRASRYLRIGSETLMTAAEELYQQGYISYPRTETEKFRPEFQHHPLIRDLAGIGGELGTYAEKLLSDNNFQNPRAGQHDDNAHPPITPCKAVNPESIADPIQRNVYVLVCKHYLACCSRDAIGKETTLTVRMATEEFTARGLMVLERNWLEIYAPWERWSTGQGELPPLEVGSRIAPSSLVIKEGRTAPPMPISEVELISLMDRNGIGTDATIAQHIATIQDRKYAIKDASQKFTPTELGIALVEGYNSMGYQLNKPDLRRETEAECNNVAAGRKTKDDIMEPILAKMLECFRRANEEAHKLDEAVSRHFPRLGSSNETTTVLQARFSECGVCHNQMALKQTIGNQQNNQNNRQQIQRKLLYCGTCRVGLCLPRGEVQPMRENDGVGPPFHCPICQYQVIRIMRGDGYTGNGYHVCPKCFSDPPAEHGGGQSNGDFRCFSCTHPTCRLAGGTQGGDTEVYSCPFCRPAAGSNIQGGKVMLRKNSRGFVLSCNTFGGGRGDRCQYTVWLPRAANTVSVPPGDENICQRCSNDGSTVRKVHFVWKSGSVPPHLGREATACILCDTVFRQEMEISLPSRNHVTPRPRATARQTNNNANYNRTNGTGARNNSNGARARNNNYNNQTNRRRNNNGQYQNGTRNGGGTVGTCFRCGQPGHYANNCPNNQ